MNTGSLTPDLGRTHALPLLARFIAMDVRMWMDRALRGFGLRRLADLPAEALTAPDSRLCRDALELAAQTSSQVVLNHALRTHAFGAVLAARSRVHLDREVFFVAALLHDLGLNDDLKDEPGSFEWVGARRARDFCVAQKMTAERASLVHEAIALHAGVGIAQRREPEVAMVHYGAGVDVLGMRLDEIPPRTLQSLLEQYPRLDFKRCFVPLLADQARRKPASHIAGHVGLGLAKRVERARFSA